MALQLFNMTFSPELKKPVQENVVEILTQEKERTAVYWYLFDKGFQRFQPEFFSINYAFKIGDRSPFLRGFQFQEKQYEILVPEKRINLARYNGFPFYDADKIDKEFMFEGALEDFILEFRNAGYQVDMG